MQSLWYRKWHLLHIIIEVNVVILLHILHIYLSPNCCLPSKACFITSGYIIIGYFFTPLIRFFLMICTMDFLSWLSAISSTIIWIMGSSYLFINCMPNQLLWIWRVIKHNKYFRFKLRTLIFCSHYKIWLNAIFLTSML